MNLTKYTILDGAMGTMLQKQGIPLGHRPELLCLTHPQQITAIHKAYIDAGAEIIYCNSFGANALKLQETGYAVEEVIPATIAVAKKAAAHTNTKVALDIGPLGELLEPTGSLSFEDAYAYFQQMVVCGEKSGADLIVFETMTDLYEVKAGVLAAKENTKLPVFVSMTFEENGRTFTGCSIEAMATLLEGLGVDAVGINCSLGPDEIYPLAKRLCESTSLPVFVKPNAGLPNPETGAYEITSQAFAESLEKYKALGISMVGGCCGTTPDYIKTLKETFSNTIPCPRAVKKVSVVSSATKVVPIEDITVIGERINPTGKKLMREALLSKDMGYILRQAISQADAGAQILDVNVGAPGADEKTLLPYVIRQIQAVTDLPLQLDSSDPEALAAGLRIYNGKAIVNSVNGDKAVLDSILPIVKKYGAAVVGLTLDANGVPETAEKRFEIAKRILTAANAYGIPKEDVYIDCLTLTVSAQQEAASETLCALERVKHELGLKTVLGVSNISFGLPNRPLLNHSFLLMAMQSGLDLPIMNPNIDSMMDAVRAFRVLQNRDKQSKAYIEAYKNMPAPTQATVIPKSTSSVSETEDMPPLQKAVLDGLCDVTTQETVELLKTMTPMDIVNEHLIPALDRVGMLFEKGTLFLPQLLQSANAAQSAFEKIKAVLLEQSDGKDTLKKGPILLATVEGDIHDIGKNIVKVILENYNYQIIDLGRDVPVSKVVEAVRETQAPIVGLSALMTTTLKNMEATIQALKNAKMPVKIIVGGAVLTEEYALKIGADYYAKDAKRAVDIAKEILG